MTKVVYAIFSMQVCIKNSRQQQVPTELSRGSFRLEQTKKNKINLYQQSALKKLNPEQLLMRTNASEALEQKQDSRKKKMCT